MTRRALKYLTLAALAAGGVSACNALGGVHLNSQVMQGLGSGVQMEPMTPVSPDAPPAVETEALSSSSGKSWSSPAARQDAQSVAPAQQVAPQTQVAAVSQPAAPARSNVPAPVVASAQSFVGQKTTIAGLGDPGRDGLWMETPLVSARRNARVTAPNGKSVVVTLEPISGSAGQGSRLSIDGMRALGLPLTELVEVRVGPA
ncbi:hypothetical protein [Tritonibacter scottomollicae]|uniref:D-galactarate dehydratase n=1 Tax=Tritonibacter scottomollicae TaxID=483013 RepID=A0A2T1AIJ3_TRISK|nr:hypothetical protein [Tritonibacter scottomollicae]PRZ48424.1 hypothetical protein CLV89_104252 [Tritonibacter scottomollicae]